MSARICVKPVIASHTPCEVFITFERNHTGSGTVKSTVKFLPPGWELEALPPNKERRECGLRLVGPDGRFVTFTHKPFQFACELTREFEANLRALQRSEDQSDEFAARPDSTGARASSLDAHSNWL